MLKTKKEENKITATATQHVWQAAPRTRRKNRSGVVYCFSDYFSTTSANFLP
jgi:hypothetical protein